MKENRGVFTNAAPITVYQFNCFNYTKRKQKTNQNVLVITMNDREIKGIKSTPYTFTRLFSKQFGGNGVRRRELSGRINVRRPRRRTARHGTEIIITLGIMLHLGAGRARVILVIGRQLRSASPRRIGSKYR